MSEQSESIAPKAHPVLQHFWKLFAVALCGLLGWGVYEAAQKPRSVLVEHTGIRPVQKNHLGSSVDVFETGVKEQSEPATVTLKDGGTVAGFYAMSDNEFVVLATLDSRTGSTTHILIPWSNIKYIKTVRNSSTKR